MRFIIGGGFHNAEPKVFNIGSSAIDMDCQRLQPEYLTESEIARISKHLCNIPGCKCDSLKRAEVKIPARKGDNF